MAKQTINIGSAANDGTGTPLRQAFDFINDNFNEVYGDNFVTQDMLNDDIVGYAELGAEFTTKATIPSDYDVDFSTAAVFEDEMDADIDYDIENPKVGDVKTLVLEGDGTDRTIGFVMSGSTGETFNKMKGSDDFSFTDGDKNLVQIICVDDTANAEVFWYSNSVVAS